MLFEGTNSLMFWHVDVLPWKSAPNKFEVFLRANGLLHHWSLFIFLIEENLKLDVKFSKKSCSEGISLGEYLTNLAAVLTRWNQTDRETLSRTGTAWVLHLRTLLNMTKESCILAFWYLVDNLLRGVLKELSWEQQTLTGWITADTYAYAWTKENVTLIVCYSYKQLWNFDF